MHCGSMYEANDYANNSPSAVMATMGNSVAQAGDQRDCQSLDSPTYHLAKNLIGTSMDTRMLASSGHHLSKSWLWNYIGSQIGRLAK